ADVVPGEAADVVRWLVAYGRVVAGVGTGGGHVELPIEPHGPAAVADAVRLAVRVRRTGAVLRAATAATALGGAAAGLVDPFAAATAPVVGLGLVAAGLAVVALSGTARSDDHPTDRSTGRP